MYAFHKALVYTAKAQLLLRKIKNKSDNSARRRAVPLLEVRITLTLLNKKKSHPRRDGY